MTTLTHTRGPLEWVPYPSQRRGVAARPATTRLAMIKRFCMCALTVVTAGSAIAAIIALKAAAFIWVFHYY